MASSTETNPVSPGRVVPEAAPPTAQDFPARFQLRIPDDADPPALAITLWIPAARAPLSLDLPAVPGVEARRENIESVRCTQVLQGQGDPARQSAEASQAIARGDTGGWIVPVGCNRVHYRVRLIDAENFEPRALMASYRQQPDQWLVPGAAVLLVPENLEGRAVMDFTVSEQTIVTHTLHGSGRVGHRLPEEASLGRVVFSFGYFETAHVAAEGTRFLHHMDEPNVAPLEGFESGLRALQNMVGLPPPDLFHVYWMGRSQDSAERLAGTNALDTVLVNYWNDLPENASESKRRSPLAVFFQQYFVALAGPRVPAWLAQSISQYAALLAWEASGAIDDRGLQAVVRAGAQATPSTTIRDAFNRWEETGDEADYRRFYRHGLGFWSVLDQEISRASAGELGLEDLSESILGLVYQRDGEPPQRFFDLLREAGVENLDVLTARWLGERDP